MRKFRIAIVFILCAILTFNLTGCGSDNKKKSSGLGGLSNTKGSEKVSDKELPIKVKGESYPLTVKEYLKDETIIKTKPERVAVLSGTPLNIW